MKKTLAVLLALMTVLTLGLTAVAEQPAAPAETDAPAFTGGVQFGMNMDQVKQLINLPGFKVDRENHKGTEYSELEYKRMDIGEGFLADVTFIFAGNSLVAIHYEMEKNASYNTVLEKATARFGASVPFDRARLGNAQYAVDDLDDCKDMIEAPGVTVVLERDDDEVEVTLFDPSALLNN